MTRGLLIVDHGSRFAEANSSLGSLARAVRQLAPALIVHIAHMELAEPTIEQGFAACVADGVDELVVMPYMLAPGRHALADIPRLVARAARAHRLARVRVAPPLGVDLLLAALVLKRCGIEVEAWQHYFALEQTGCSAEDPTVCAAPWCED